MRETLEYCKSDVQSSIAMFFEPEQQQEIQQRFRLTTKFGLDIRKTIYLTNAKFGALTLGATGQPKKFDTGLENYFVIPDFVRVENPEVRDFFEKTPVGKIETKTIHMYGLDFVLSAGGLHASKEHYIGDGKYILIDVVQYYPSMMDKYGLLSRAVTGHYRQRYADNITERNSIKHSDPELSIALKLNNNTASGAGDAPFNPMYDPFNTISLRILGQLLLIDLCEKIGDLSELIFVNTDGILIKEDDYEKVRPHVEE